MGDNFENLSFLSKLAGLWIALVKIGEWFYSHLGLNETQ